MTLDPRRAEIVERWLTDKKLKDFCRACGQPTNFDLLDMIGCHAADVEAGHVIGAIYFVPVVCQNWRVNSFDIRGAIRHCTAFG
jgi:hypothetical protein